jgi:hypothetical protein
MSPPKELAPAKQPLKITHILSCAKIIFLSNGTPIFGFLK